VGEYIVRVQLGNLLRYLDCLIVALQILQNARQPVHGFGKARICGQRFAIGGYSIFQFTLRHKIERGVIVVFGFLAGFCVGHCGNFLAESGF